MLGQRNKTHIIVGKDLAPLAETETRADLSAGQIGVFKNQSTTAIDGTTDLTTGDTFRVVYKTVSGDIVESPNYEYDKLLTKTAANYSASAEQKTYIGYNGTTGSIAANNSDIYHIHMIRKDWSATWGEHGSYKLVAAYESDASATETEIADALVTNAVKNFGYEKSKSGYQVTKAGRINSATVTAANGFKNTQDVTVVKGDPFVTCDTDVTYEAAGGSTLVVGDYLRIGGVGAGTALTSQVYKVTAINSTVVSLDRPVLEDSGTYTAVDGTSDIEVIPAATAAAANWGLSFESAPVKFDAGLFKFQNVTFEVSLSDAFGSTIITLDTSPSKGIGTYEEIAELEWELRGNRGEGYKVASYPVSFVPNATSGKTYDVINLRFRDDSTETINGYSNSFHSLIIATEDESVGTIHTDLKDVLNIS